MEKYPFRKDELNPKSLIPSRPGMEPPSWSIRWAQQVRIRLVSNRGRAEGYSP